MEGKTKTPPVTSRHAVLLFFTSASVLAYELLLMRLLSITFWYHFAYMVISLALQAQERLKRLKYANVSVRVGDGYYGWEEAAPFDRIIVTCAASLVPPPLLQQLKPGGKMCIPVGAAYSVQFLTMVEKSETGTITMRKSIPVRFVPLTRSGNEE